MGRWVALSNCVSKRIRFVATTLNVCCSIFQPFLFHRGTHKTVLHNCHRRIDGCVTRWHEHRHCTAICNLKYELTKQNKESVGSSSTFYSAGNCCNIWRDFWNFLRYFSIFFIRLFLEEPLAKFCRILAGKYYFTSLQHGHCILSGY